MIKGIEHVAIASKDTAALKDWYVKIFGMSVVYDNGKGTYFVAAPDNFMIEIIKADNDTYTPALSDGGIRHFAIGVTCEQFNALVDVINKEDVEVICGPDEKNGIKTFFFRDIDGNIFHLIYRPNSLV